MIALYDCDEWIEPNHESAWRPPRYKLERLLNRFGRRYFVVESRIEPPEGDSLTEFSILVSGPLSVPVGGLPRPSDRALYLYGTHWSGSEAETLKGFEGMLTRKIGHLDVGSVAIRVTPASLWTPTSLKEAS